MKGQNTMESAATARPAYATVERAPEKEVGQVTVVVAEDDATSTMLQSPYTIFLGHMSV